MARKDFTILRGFVVVRDSEGGMTGRPWKAVLEAPFVDIVRVLFVVLRKLLKLGLMFFDSCVKCESMNSWLYIAIAIAANAKRMEKSVFIDRGGATYTSLVGEIENVRRRAWRG